MFRHMLCSAVVISIMLSSISATNAQAVIHGEQAVNFFASQGLTDGADSNLGYGNTIPDFSTNTISLTGLSTSINELTALVLDVAGDFDQASEHLGINVEGVSFGTITNSNVNDDRFDGGTGHFTGNPFVGGPTLIPAGADRHPWGSSSTDFAGSGADRQTFRAIISDTELTGFLLDGQLDVELTFFENVGNSAGQIRVSLESTTTIPEPSSLLMLGIGIATFARMRRRISIGT